MRKYIFGAMLGLLLSATNIFAADNGNGVDVTSFNFNKYFKIHAEWFTDHDPEDTVFFEYNESAGTSTTDGQLDTSFIDNGTLIVSLPTFGTGTMTVRVEGKVKDAGVWAVIDSTDYTAGTTIANPVYISNFWDSVRVGALVTGSAVDALTVEGDFIGIKRN